MSVDSGIPTYRGENGIRIFKMLGYFNEIYFNYNII